MPSSKARNFQTFVGAARPSIANFLICSMLFRAPCVDFVNYQAVATMLAPLHSNVKGKSFQTLLGAVPC